MHGPDGKNYPGEFVFAEIEPVREVIVGQVSEPKFRLTIAFTPSATVTLVSWSQAFENPEVALRLAPIVVPAYEQNLTRLAEEVWRDLEGDLGCFQNEERRPTVVRDPV